MKVVLPNTNEQFKITVRGNSFYSRELSTIAKQLQSKGAERAFVALIDAHTGKRIKYVGIARLQGRVFTIEGPNAFYVHRIRR